MNNLITTKQTTPWNKGRIPGQKPASKLKEIWEIRICLQMENNIHELTLFNVAIDSKLRGCDLVQLKVNDVMRNGKMPFVPMSCKITAAVFSWQVQASSLR